MLKELPAGVEARRGAFGNEAGARVADDAQRAVAPGKEARRKRGRRRIDKSVVSSVVVMSNVCDANERIEGTTLAMIKKNVTYGLAYGKEIMVQPVVIDKKLHQCR